MRVFLYLGILACALVGAAAPAQASTASAPGHQHPAYSQWRYPKQISYGPIENGLGSTGEAPAPGAFLTLPFMGPHYITSIFDHCYPGLGTNGSVCRYDGVEASAKVGGPDPGFDAGFAQTPGGHDYIYYDGHAGWDYGMWYEPVAAAAPGIVMHAGWDDPNCHTCLGGLSVEINHRNGLITYYGHLSKIQVSLGQGVSRGQVIATSGMTGTATGPHLHFGVYLYGGGGPVDPYGWSGSWPDPWTRDVGDLWLTGSPRFADITLPHANVNAVKEVDNPDAIDVTWSSPGAGAYLKVYVVTQDGTMRLWSGAYGAGHATFHGGPSQTYWFWATVTTSLGWADAAGSPVVLISGRSHGELQAA
jgi:murein DD-endopeptidase MepM/ murein hydrolase activator NlpD